MPAVEPLPDRQSLAQPRIHPDEPKILLQMDARQTAILLQTTDEAEAFQLIWKIAQPRNLILTAWSASKGVHDPFLTDESIAETETAAAGLSYLVHQPLQDHIVILFDILEHLQDSRTVRHLRDLITHLRRLSRHLILIDPSDRLPEAVREDFAHISLSIPDPAELERIVRETVKESCARLRAPAEITTSAWTQILRNLQGLSRRQIQQVVREAVAEDRRFDEKDIGTVLARKRTLLFQHGVLEYVECPIRLDEIAGFEKLKAWLKQRETALTSGDAYNLRPPRGILMLGVPGTGKSLCAKAVATAWQRPLLRLDPSGLYDKYIGESERQLRKALQQAEAMSPIVLWIDEIEKGFAGAASQSVDGGLSQRMFGTLLTWMQEHRSPVFLVATANNIDALPPELLRKGRFDEIFFVDLPGPGIRRAIFTVHLTARRLDPSKFDLSALTTATEGYTGSEIEQAILSAVYSGLSASRAPDTHAILDTLKTSPPLSVTMRERLAALREWGRTRCAPVD